MYQTILVPLDGSAFGERALPMAIEFARKGAAQVVLVRAASASVLPGVDPTEAQVEAVREAETYLAEIATGLEEQKIQAVTAVPYGGAVESIVLEIEMRQADLVIMCTHGRSGPGRLIYGSVAEGVIAESPAPVLLVRPSGLQAPLVGGTGGACLVVPLDGSALAEAALSHARMLARSFDCSILLVSAVAPLWALYSDVATVTDVLEADRERAKQYLAEVAERLKRDNLRVQTAVREGAAADTILQEAQSAGARLIVMATHGRTGLLRLLLGSVALEVVHRTLLPVLLVRPGEVEAAEEERPA